MKKKSVYLIIIVTLVNLTALATMIYHHYLSPDLPRRAALRESRFERVNRELALTPDQLGRFEEIRDEFHGRLDSLNQVMENQRQQLLQEIWQQQPREVAIDALLQRISLLQMESQRLVIWHFYEFKEVLTPEQWRKLYGIVADHFPASHRSQGLHSSAATENEN